MPERPACASEYVSDKGSHFIRITFIALAANLRYGLTTQSQWRRTEPEWDQDKEKQKLAMGNRPWAKSKEQWAIENYALNDS